MAYATIAIMNWNVTGSIGRRLPQVVAPFQACISIAKHATIRRQSHCGFWALPTMPRMRSVSSGDGLSNNRPCKVRVVISTREFSGMNRNGLGMRIYRSTLLQSCVCPDLGFSENSGTARAAPAPGPDLGFSENSGTAPRPAPFKPEAGEQIGLHTRQVRRFHRAYGL